MTEKASADDFQVQDFLKKKKKRKHKEHNKKHENDERESIQNAELSYASPLLCEDQAAQSGEGCKKKKKKKHKGEKQQPSLDNSCVGLEHEVSNESGVDASQKKKKKKKQKYDGTDDQSDAICVTVNQHIAGSCQEINADYIYLKQSVKKKRKERLPDGDEVRELPTSETHDKNVKKSKKKKKKRGSSTQDMQEDTDVTVDQSLLSCPEQNRQGEDTVSLSPTEDSSVATPQQWHEGGDCNAASAVSEDSMDIPTNFSKTTKADDRTPQKSPVHARKEIKSSALVTEDSSSESDIM